MRWDFGVGVDICSILISSLVDLWFAVRSPDDCEPIRHVSISP